MQLFINYCKEQTEYFNKIDEIQEECKNENKERQTRPNKSKRAKNVKQTRQKKKVKKQQEVRDAPLIDLESDNEEVVIIKQVTGVGESLEIVCEILEEILSPFF